MAHGMLVVPESRQGQFAGHHASAKPAVAFQHQDFLSGGGQVGGGHEAVVAGTHGNDVGVCHVG